MKFKRLTLTPCLVLPVSRTSEIHGRETRGEREKNFRPMHKQAFLLLIFAIAGESIWPVFSALDISTSERIRPEMGKYPKDAQKSKIWCVFIYFYLCIFVQGR